MKIDWAALGIVAVVSIAATVLFVVLLAGGIRLVAAIPAGTGPRTGPSVGPSANGVGSGQVAPRATTSARVFGFILLGLAGALVLLGIYLILPFSR